MISEPIEPKPRILIVEDEALIAEDLAFHLEKLGYAICGEATTGEQAVVVAGRERPDLVLMDIVLKGDMDGIEAADLIRTYYGTPVIFISSFADEDKLKRAKLTMPLGYILKPFREADLKITIDIVLYVSKVDADRKKAEKALQDSERKYRELVERTDNLVVRISGEGILLYANHIAQEVFGITPAECMGRSLIEFVYSEDLERTQQAFIRWIHDRVSQGFFENRLLSRSGQIFDMLWSINFQYDDQGNLQMANAIATNITSRKIMEKEITRSKERYQNLIQRVPIGVMSVDSRFYITEWNATAQAITGLTEEECLGQLCSELLGCDAFKGNCPLRKAIEKRTMIGPLERNVKNSSGMLVPIRCFGAPISDENDAIIGAIFTFQDVSELRTLEMERQMFISMLAHDMKSPLVCIQGFANRLKDKPSEYQLDNINNYLQIIFNEAGRLENIINDFLDISLIRTGHLKLNIRPTDLKLELLDLIEVLMPRFTKAGLTLEIEFDDYLPLLNVDPSKIRRVFTNLLENAVKHSAPNTVISLKALATNTEVLLKLTDQGPGISPEDLPFIFEPFYRGNIKKKSPGYGLGLAGVQAIVKAHGGKVFALSKVAHGSTFTVVIPRNLIISDRTEK